jgi:RimJ/RimL family protein N-acetyltransferase
MGGDSGAVTLRAVTRADLDVLYAQQLEHDGRRMAAFTRKEFEDRGIYDAHWAKLAADESVTTKAVLFGDELAGYVGKFVRAGDAEVTYWLGRAYWGKGIATKALTLFLDVVKERPLCGRVVSDNVASLRVLQKCGFTIIGHETAFAEARGEDVEEIVLELSEH